MESKNYSVEVTVLENGKYTKGTLTLFIDEYVFGSNRTNVNWENVTCEQGTTKVKSFLFSSDKPYVVFNDKGKRSIEFILEPEKMSELLNIISDFANYLKEKRIKVENEKRKVEEERIRKETEQKEQEEKERQIREEAQRKAEEEFAKKKKEEELKKQEQERLEKELLQRKQSEKQQRIDKEVAICKENKEFHASVDATTKKAASCFLDNPYRILGISCVASNEEANQALDKLKKLARLKALESYKSSFDLMGIEQPARDLSIAQNALAMIKDKSHKWFWFAKEEACFAWHSGKYRIELNKDGQEFGNYDLFLANYLYAVILDSKFETAETWKRILNYYCYICKQSTGEVIKSRFTEQELQGKQTSELLAEFKANIFKPIMQLCETDDLVSVLRLNKYIKDCNDKLLDRLSRDILEKVASWFKEKEDAVFEFLKPDGDAETVSESRGKEIRERGEQYCQVVEKVLDDVLKELTEEPVRRDMIKESYKRATYQLMYELHKCVDKTNAIYFANKTYSYCKEDDRQRIRNTFGDANIKFIDWNIPHTGWDIQGDNYYYGKGCEVDFTQAVYWYHKAADAGNMYSQNSLGICYQKGNGVPQSDSQAVSWFEKAYKSGNPEGAYNLAECYFAGMGVNKSVDKALELWAEAAKLGHPSAADRRAGIYTDVQKNRKAHRAKNHICIDIGFQMPMGSSIVAEVTLNKPAYAYLVNAQNYQNYLEGKDFSHNGGYTTDIPFRIRITSSNHWYVIVDNGDGDIGDITASAKAKTVGY